MQAYRLTSHPAFAPLAVTSIEARVNVEHPHWVTLRWRIEGSAEVAALPPSRRQRADNLWEQTCFELFLKPDGGSAYTEFNLSPSGEWNAYDFDGYRDGMRERIIPRVPVCTFRAGSVFTIFDAAIPKSAMPQVDCLMGLNAVIEEQGGQKSYWAIAHPEADQPDFHDQACFAAKLRATGLL